MSGASLPLDISCTREQVSSLNTEHDGLTIEWWSDIRPQGGCRWLVDEIIPANALIALVGNPGAGKSYLALDLAAHLAAGRPWFGRPTMPGLVVYVAAEDPQGLRLRLTGLRETSPLPADLPLALIAADFDLRKQRDLRRLSAALQAAMAQAESALTLIIIDTLSRTFGDGDENGADMTAYVRQLGSLQSLLGCSIIILHHPPKNTSGRTPRGHSSLPAACDTVLLLCGKRPRRLVVEKQRNGRSDLSLYFELHHIGEYDTCVVRPSMAPPINFVASASTEDERVLIEQLALLVDREGVSAPSDLPEEARVRAADALLVKNDSWEQHARIQMSCAGRKPDSVRRAFQRSKDRLLRAGIVDSWGAWVWRAP